ncbi:cell division protein ZapA [Leptospira wolffii]|uniref:Cell division protein ZapA n=1 Tax=Leptospira wolffii TaxID=409998 RepID=A0A2M9Z8B9_9LEPT|nr:cell division protein ZapA [Leptospira wolffii]EPG67696.1 cell division protein ZapA [Leptospira wolffii serovar Khorat str. Khorat-H2]PJZ64592.1 cell division protein ZapA [Leptospira wolffii]TGK55162.1 cell division protein ZapA [Leptospira wolffii]TGK70537.1 cell division protein ZapA [Leptospira wolffii]TGK77615.1 cell division protein ZapA [Leptospira wolffii]
MSGRVNARIQGDDYTIVGDTDPEYIHRLAELVDRKIRELHLGMPNASKLKLAVLAALNFADELEQAKSQTSEAGPSSPEAEEKTRKLITLIEEGLIGDV